MDGEEVEMDMTPMIDVSFQLLIFFILTLNFPVQEGNLNTFLPKDRGMQKTQKKKKRLDDFKATLLFDPSQGVTTVEISGKTVVSWKEGDEVTDQQRATIAQESVNTYKTIMSQGSNADAPPVKIDAKSNVPSGRVILVLDVLKANILDQFKGAKLMWTGNVKQEWGVSH